MNRLLRTALLGAGAGAVAGIVQPTVGKVEDLLVFPDGEDTNIPRHLVEATGEKAGVGVPGPVGQVAGTAFHVGYALFWGTAYAFVREKRRVPPLAGGLGLAAVLYTVAFSRVGAGTLVGSEPPPGQRAPRHWLLTLTMPLVYGLTTSYVYERLRRRAPGAEARGDATAA